MTRLSEVPIRQLVWLLPLAFALHELEEWNILEWYQQYWTNINPELMTRRTVWTHLVWSSLFGFGWTFFATRFRRSKITLHIVLVYFTVVAFGHTFAHIYWLFDLGAYAPGIVTAAFLIIPITVYVFHRALEEKLVSGWYVALLVAISLRLPISGVRLNYRLPDEGLGMYRFASQLAGFLFGPAA